MSDLQHYLTQMESELNEFKKLMETKSQELSKSAFFCWFYLDDELLKKYIPIVEIGINTDNKEDREISKTKTYDKLLELDKYFALLRNS